MRLAVYLLFTEMNGIESDVRALIFSAVFVPELQNQRLESIGKVALESQYRERLRAGRESTWGRILANPTTTAEKNERAQLLARLRGAEAQLDLDNTPASKWPDWATIPDRDRSDAAHREIAHGFDPKYRKKRLRGRAPSPPSECPFLLSTSLRRIDERDRVRDRSVPAGSSAVLTSEDEAGDGAESTDVSESKDGETRKNEGKEDGESEEDVESEENEGEATDAEGASGLAETSTDVANRLSDQRSSETTGIQPSISLINHTGEHVQQPTAQIIPIGQLEMLHYNHIGWEGTIAFITTDFPLQFSIDHTSGVYHTGGQVHRVVLPAGKLVDVMVCDTRICTDCNSSASSTVPSMSHGRPFVHSSSIVVDGEHCSFFETPTPPQSMHCDSSVRMVQFKGVYGDVMCETSVCDVEDCLGNTTSTGCGYSFIGSLATLDFSEFTNVEQMYDGSENGRSMSSLLDQQLNDHGYAMDTSTSVDEANGLTVGGSLSSGSAPTFQQSLFSHDEDEMQDPYVPLGTVYPSNGVAMDTTAKQTGGLRSRHKTIESIKPSTSTSSVDESGPSQSGPPSDTVRVSLRHVDGTTGAAADRFGGLAVKGASGDANAGNKAGKKRKASEAAPSDE